MNSAANPQDLIYHEKQEGRLCAVHCLNNLLQGSYYTAVELGNLADQLDEEERQRLAEGGFDSEDYRRFIASPSSNKDDTGYFSLQVIQKALSIFTLETIPFNSKSSDLAIRLRANPTLGKAYICHFHDHWLAIRMFGPHWINLNSLQSKPKPISNTYLSLYLEQLQTEGYSIYIVAGDTFPKCEADEYLANNPLPEWYSKKEPSHKTSRSSALVKEGESSHQGSLYDYDDDVDNADMESAIAASLRSQAQDEERNLEMAIQMSKQE